MWTKQRQIDFDFKIDAFCVHFNIDRMIFNFKCFPIENGQINETIICPEMKFSRSIYSNVISCTFCMSENK